MQNTTQNLPSLAEYVTVRDLLPQVQPNIPSVSSIHWITRQHRDQLVRSGAVIKLVGRVMYHPDLFKRAVVEISHAATMAAETNHRVAA